MRIMIINPDWNVGESRMKWELEQLSAYVGAETELCMECLSETKVYLDSPADAVLAGPEILSMAVKAEREGFDAILLYCFSDPALNACRQVVEIPVVGAGQTACLTIPQVGYHGTVLLADGGRVPEKLAAVHETGLQPERILGFEGIDLEGLDCVRDREEVLERLTEAGRRALERTPSQALVLGCLSFLGMARELEERLKVPVIDPAALGAAQAELMARIGLKSSRRAYPKRKDADFSAEK